MFHSPGPPATLACVVSWVILLAACAPADTRTAAKPASASPSPTVVSAAPTLVPPPSASAQGWVSKSVRLGSIEAIAVDPAAAYVLYLTPGAGQQDPTATGVARLDRPGAQVKTSRPLLAATSIAVSGRSLWVGGPGSVYELDASTLETRRTIPLAAAGGAPAPRVLIDGTPSMLLAAYGNQLYALDPGSGLPIFRAQLAGVAVSLSADPSGSLVYVGTENLDPSSGASSVGEWRLATGSMVTSAASGGAGLGGPRVAASGDGVWIAYATGMQGVLEHRRAADLALIPVPAASAGGSNGIRASIVAGVLWLTDGMTQQLRCADPSTGAIRAGTVLRDSGPVAGDASGTYLGGIEGLDVLSPDPRCAG